MSIPTLRDYQREAVEALRENFARGIKRQILCAPTGSGKTLCAAYMIQQAMRKGPGTILFLVDRVALARQTSAEFTKFGIPHGMVQGEYTHGKHMDVQICSMQSLEKRGFFPGRNIRLVVYDEAHELRKEIIKFILNWDGPTIGLTATPFRQGLGKIYQACVDLITTDQLVSEKWLSEMRVIAGVQPNMKGAATRNDGEWSGTAVTERGRVIIGDILSTWMEQTQKHFGGPVKTIVFSASVAHGRELCEAFQDAGFDFRQISYLDRDDEERERKIQLYRDGKITGLVSVDALCLSEDTEVLTTDGWVGCDDMTTEHKVAQYDPDDESVCFGNPVRVIRRDVMPHETWVTHTGHSIGGGFRVTGNHRMLVATTATMAWKNAPAMDIVEKRRFIPVSANALPLPVALPPSPASSKSDLDRRISANSFHLRKGGMGNAESKREALRRIQIRDELAYTAIEDLTDDECRLAGFWIGDGMHAARAAILGNSAYVLSQSEGVPPYCFSWVEDVVGQAWAVDFRTTGGFLESTAP